MTPDPETVVRREVLAGDYVDGTGHIAERRSRYGDPGTV